ncbi:nicotinamide-nucleotide adenylyltransferase [Candidatus Peregrinibacteria bacterium]|nr:nicotinamide-nucleotide adenylyltransferase [Candidatus Peregrinibacteria bacterium]
MKAGLYTGRFQPFHLGHLSAIKQALKQVDRLYIAVGSSQYSHEEYNPFTADERVTMIKLALEENKLADKCEVFQVPDIHDDDEWTAHVRKIAPSFEAVFVGNNGLVKELFDKEGWSPVVEVEHEVDVSATKIRCAINQGLDWERHVTPGVAEYIRKIDGIQRIRQL